MSRLNLVTSLTDTLWGVFELFEKEKNQLSAKDLNGKYFWAWGLTGCFRPTWHNLHMVFSQWELLDESHTLSPTHVSIPRAIIDFERRIWNPLGYQKILQQGSLSEPALVDYKVRAVYSTLFKSFDLLWELPAGPRWHLYVCLPLELFGLAEQPRNPHSQWEKPCLPLC